jgi:alpha-N-arabinofuranosidase
MMLPSHSVVIRLGAWPLKYLEQASRRFASCSVIGLGSLFLGTVILPGWLSYASARQLHDQAGSVVVHVNVKRDLGPVNRLVLGNNVLGYLHSSPVYSAKGAGLWDPTTRQPVQEMLRLARGAGVSSLRWPGGCGVHEFNWKTTVGPPESRPQQAFGLGEFLEVAEALGVVPVITIADFWGEPQDAADLVEYLNAPVGSNPNGGVDWAAVRARQGHPDPYGVRWFEYGNETEHGTHELNSPPRGAQMTPQKYAERFNAVASAMKKIDPDVRLGAVLGSEATLPLSSWTTAVLDKTRDTADFYIYHAYLPRYSGNSPHPAAESLFELGFASTEQLDLFVRRLRAEINRATHREVPLAITEFNGAYVQDLPAPYRLSQGAAVQVADLVMRFLRPAFNIAFANYWQLSNEYWGMVKGYETPYVKRPAYHVFALIHQFLGDRLIDAVTTTPGYETPGGYGVLATGPRSSAFDLGAAEALKTSWKISAVSGARASADAAGVLTVELSGASDVNYYHATIDRPALPNTGYRVSAEVRNQALNATAARIEIIDGRGWVATRSSTLSPAVRSLDWTLVSADYVTLPDAKGITIRARRLGGRPEAGTIQIRNVQIRPFSPDRVESIPYITATATRAANRIAVFLINRNVHQSMPITIRGVPPGEGDAWTLAAPRVDSNNEVGAFTVQPQRLSVEWKDETLMAVLPPHSFSVVNVVMNEGN